MISKPLWANEGVRRLKDSPCARLWARAVSSVMNVGVSRLASALEGIILLPQQRSKTEGDIPTTK